MKLGDSGEAFFVEEVTPSELGDDEIIPPHLACSPIPDDAFLPHFHDTGTTIAEIPDNTQINVDLHEDYVGITHSYQQSIYERIQSDESNANNLSKDSSQVQIEASSQGGYAETYVTNENVNFQKPVTINAGTSVPKTFCAETLNNDDGNKSEKVRRISIVAAEFRPITLAVEDDVPAIRNGQGLLVDLLDGQNVMEGCSSCQGQGLRHRLMEKDSGKDSSTAGSEDVLKPNSGGKRKRRKKSLMKKKGAAQRKNGVGSSSQVEQLEMNDSSGLVKTSVEMQQGGMDDSSEGIYQAEDLNTQTDDGSSSQEVCSFPIRGNLLARIIQKNYIYFDEMTKNSVTAFRLEYCKC
jgi:phosphatidate phosphatase LPIN